MRTFGLIWLALNVWYVGSSLVGVILILDIRRQLTLMRERMRTIEGRTLPTPPNA